MRRGHRNIISSPECLHTSQLALDMSHSVRISFYTILSPCYISTVPGEYSHNPLSFPNMTTIIEINKYFAAVEAVLSTFQSLTARITVLLRLEGPNIGGLENLIAISILKGAEDNRNVLAALRKATLAVAVKMDMARLEKLVTLLERLAEKEAWLVEREAVLKDRMKSYESRRSDSHVVSF